MKYETLEEEYEPETKKEHDCLQSVFAHVGTWPECESCGECTSECELIIDDYEGLISM